MKVLPFTSSSEELRLTVTSAEILSPGLSRDEEISFSCEISSLPNHNCNMIFRSVTKPPEIAGRMNFQADRPLVTVEVLVSTLDFQKVTKICYLGEPIRPITFYLKIVKSPEISDGEIGEIKKDFVLNIKDISWRHPLF